MTIVDFLLARIAEDETCRFCDHPVARHVGQWCRMPTGAIKKDGTERICCCESATADARLLAECQAKRAIVEEHRGEVGYVVAYRESDRLIAEGYDLDTVPLQASAAMVPTCLRSLAAVYADHPDYDEAWRVA